MTDRYSQWAETALSDEAISREDALAIVRGEDIDLAQLVAAAGRPRRHWFGDRVAIHILENVRNGACPEDCGYCGQSRDSTAPIQPYKTKSVDEIVAEAEAARDSGAYRFCMALSGRGPKDKEIEHMCEAIEKVRAMGLRTCLSAGLLDEEKARRLREAGLDRFNHNLNTSRRHYPEICTTHTYDDRTDTLRALRSAGVSLCSGLIVGMGENHEDLVDVAFDLRNFRADSIPVNFLLPIEGNPIQDPRCNGEEVSPQLALRVLCMMRLVNPSAEVRVAAGREQHLGPLEAMALWPANSLFMEGYLLTEGDDAERTLRMIVDAGFEPLLEEGQWPEKLQAIARGEGRAAGAAVQPGGNGCCGAEAKSTRLKLTVSKSEA